jgi:outer membrane immunogenic protein
MWRRLQDNSYTRFGSNTTTGAPMGSVANDTAYLSSEQGALGTLRGRIGYAPSNWLLYLTGGLAVGHTEHSFTEVLSPGNTCSSAANCRNTSDSQTKAGWTVGAGAEWAFAPAWSLGLEYLYVDLGSTTLTLAPTGGFFPNTSTATFDDRSHIARLKVNYRWGQ